MIDPRNFYLSFIDDYHKFKVTTLERILNDLPKYEKEFFGEELNEEDREAYKKTLKSEIRQTYFHSVETFFQIFFALDPTDKLIFDDDNILFKLTSSGYTPYKRIEEISTDNNSLDFLEKEINFNGHTITIGHYIFYYGIFENGKFPPSLFPNISKSIKAIKHGISIIANDFIKINRQEYNSYKHGLRIIPSLKELSLYNPETKEITISWDLSDSMSFYENDKKLDQIKVVTKVFDTNKDICMIRFCSNLISNMIFYRKVSKFKENIKQDKIPIYTFGEKEIDECNKTNVKIQDFVWTIKRP